VANQVAGVRRIRSKNRSYSMASTSTDLRAAHRPLRLGEPAALLPDQHRCRLVARSTSPVSTSSLEHVVRQVGAVGDDVIVGRRRLRRSTARRYRASMRSRKSIRLRSSATVAPGRSSTPGARRPDGRGRAAARPATNSHLRPGITRSPPVPRFQAETTALYSVHPKPEKPVVLVPLRASARG
jgi:hypothetical protein